MASGANKLSSGGLDIFELLTGAYGQGRKFAYILRRGCLSWPFSLLAVLVPTGVLPWEQMERRALNLPTLKPEPGFFRRCATKQSQQALPQSAPKSLKKLPQSKKKSKRSVGGVGIEQACRLLRLEDPNAQAKFQPETFKQGWYLTLAWIISMRTPALQHKGSLYHETHTRGAPLATCFILRLHTLGRWSSMIASPPHRALYVRRSCPHAVFLKLDVPFGGS